MPDSERNERKEHLEYILDRLPPQEKNVMTLYYLEGLGMKQIAHEMGLTTGRISQIHKTTLRKLKEEHGNEKI